MNYNLILLSLTLALTVDAISGYCQRRVCYTTNYGNSIIDLQVKMNPQDIDPYLCTHIIYAYANITGNKVTAFEENDESECGTGNYAKIVGLRKLNPDLKVLISAGAPFHVPSRFHHVVDTASSRKEFTENAVRFVKKHRFDGLDLIGTRNNPANKDKFSLLLAELRKAFNKERLLLTIAAYPLKHIIDQAYDVPSLAPNVDWINLFSHDLYGSWGPTTGHHSPLYKSFQDKGDSAQRNVAWVANYWAQLGMPKNKIVVGVPTFGRSFTLKGTNNGVGAPSSLGTSGPYLKTSGLLAYYEVCEFIKNRGAIHTIADQHALYLVFGNQWISFENENSLTEKVQWIKQHGFGGVMVWALNHDDFNGQHCSRGKYPLLNAILQECSK